MYSTHLFARGRVVLSTVLGALKAILVNLEFLGGDNTVAGEPMWGAFGVYGRPRAPVEPADATAAKPAGHTEVVGVRFGDGVTPLVYRDLRLSARVNPKAGEVGLVQYEGGFICLKDNADANGTDITVYAVRRKTDGTPDKAHVLSFDTTTGNSNVTITHETGATITLTKDGKIVAVSPSGESYVEVKDSGVVVNGANVAITGGAMLGDADPASGELVMLSTQLLVWIGQVNAALAAGNAAGPILPAPTAIPAAATKVKAK